MDEEKKRLHDIIDGLARSIDLTDDPGHFVIWAKRLEGYSFKQEHLDLVRGKTKGYFRINVKRLLKEEKELDKDNEEIELKIREIIKLLNRLGAKPGDITIKKRIKFLCRDIFEKIRGKMDYCEAIEKKIERLDYILKNLEKEEEIEEAAA
ncbi:hypothetical protein CMO89_00645 [Candidatus Woesearchaeota archaeon]|nr:hypothetical protein [Candidatus Woesearchaeota archaeon]|tara:strand:+ start:7121 stop:7573 length:453 start_codon:yes stop_codon:yes gene_type:complete